MNRDARGLPVSGASSRALEAIDHFASQLLSLGPDTGAVTAAADAHPECALLQAYAASMYIYAQLRAEAAKAAPLIERARARRADLTERERIFVEAIAAGCDGEFDRALALHEQIGASWPTDAIAAKVAEFHLFETGDAPRQLRFMAAIEGANRGEAEVQGMYAFALELNGRRKEAEQTARRALALKPASIWTQHCLAHVYSGDFRIDEGIAALQGWTADWKAGGQYIQSHNWFHLGALHLANLDYGRVLDGYRSHIWGFTPDLVVEQTDAILMLWYLELAGAEVEQSMWRAIAARVRPYAREHLFPFLNATRIYALGRAGDEALARDALDDLAGFARGRAGPAARVWLQVGLPEAEASLAFARGDWQRAARLFGAILPEIAIGGGSDEQRGVFSQSYLFSLIRSGQRAAASALLSGWLGARKPIPLEDHWLAQL